MAANNSHWIFNNTKKSLKQALLKIEKHTNLCVYTKSLMWQGKKYNSTNTKRKGNCKNNQVANTSNFFKYNNSPKSINNGWSYRYNGVSNCKALIKNSFCNKQQLHYHTLTKYAVLKNQPQHATAHNAPQITLGKIIPE